MPRKPAPAPGADPATDTDSLLEQIDRVQGTPGAVVYLRRFDGAEYAHLAMMPAAEFDLETVAGRFGGGRYHFVGKVQGGGALITRGAFSIAGPAKLTPRDSSPPAGAAPMTAAAPADLVPVILGGRAVMVARDQLPLYEALNAMREERKAPAAPPPPAPPTIVEQLGAFGQALGLFKQLAPPPPPPPAPLSEAIATVSAMETFVAQRSPMKEGAPLDSAAGAIQALAGVDWAGAAQFVGTVIREVGRVLPRRTPATETTAPGEPIDTTARPADSSPREGAASAARRQHARAAAPDSTHAQGAAPDGAGGAGTPPPAPPADGWGALVPLVRASARSDDPTPDSLADVLVDIFDDQGIPLAAVIAVGMTESLISADATLEQHRPFIEAVEQELRARDAEDANTHGAAAPAPEQERHE